MDYHSFSKTKFFSLQLRLDFDTFVISGPVTDTTNTYASATTGIVNGDGTNKKAVSMASRCLDDIFTVSNPGGITPPAICGRNSGSHSKFYSF